MFQLLGESVSFMVVSYSGIFTGERSAHDVNGHHAINAWRMPFQPSLSYAWSPFFVSTDSDATMKTTLSLFLVLLLCTVTEFTTAFVSSCSRVRGETTLTLRFAAAPKKKAKKSAKAKQKEEVETFRKAEFVSTVQKKTGLSKVDSEAALQAVLETITEVCFCARTVNVHSLSSCDVFIRTYPPFYIAGGLGRKAHKLGGLWNLQA